MANIKPSSHGIVVENKESGLRYASHDSNFDPRSERKVRDLRHGETVLSYGIKGPRPSFNSSSDEGFEEETTSDAGDTEQGDSTLNTEGR